MNRKKRNTFLNIVCLVLFTALLHTVNQYKIPVLNTIGCLALVSAVSQILYEGNALKKEAFSVIYVAMSAMGELLITFLLSIFSPIIMLGINSELINSLAGLTAKIILLVLIRVITKRFPQKFNNEKPITIFMLTVFPALGLVAMLVILNFSYQLNLPLINQILVIFLILGLLASGIAVFFIYDNSMQLLELEHQNKLFKKNEQMNEMIFKEQCKNSEQRNAIIHDFKKHLLNIQKVADTTQAITYSQELLTEYEDQLSDSLFDVHNLVLSNILWSLRHRCSTNNIELKLDIEYIHFSFIGNADTSILFDNLFDNAVEACQRVLAVKWITVELFRVQDYVMIRVSNSHNGQVRMHGNSFLSSHRNYEGTGYGIDNIKNVAEKYGGCAIFEHDKESFTAIARLEINGD